VSPRALAALAALLLVGCPRGGGRPGSPQPPAARLEPPGPRFFAVGDSGTGGPDQYQVGRAIRDKCRASGCDFGVLLGDNFYPDGVASADDPQWRTKFEDPYAELVGMGVPFYGVLGNHDYADGRDFGLGEHQVAYGAGHPHWRMPAPHYVFDHGSVLFLVLDTTRLDAGQRDAEREQDAMAKGALEGNSRRWVIALGHHPYASNGQNGDARRPLARFLQARVCGKADVYLAAHDHNLQVLPPPPGCDSLQIISGGGGYQLYALPGGHPSLFQAQAFGFVYVTVEGDRLTLEMVGADGATLFRHELNK
jgi:tartrate-resistant acid phosphatase type 5